MTTRAIACSPGWSSARPAARSAWRSARRLQRYGAPEEVLTDNGKQFTDRFGRGGEVLFDKICRRNGIAHRLTAPRSPTTTGKIERFHQTLRRELLDDARPFASLLEAQAALDDWVREYNAERPHQALETRAPVTPAERFQPARDEQRELLGLWLPAQPGGGPGAGSATPTVERAIDAGADAAGRRAAGRSSSTASFRRRGTCGRCAASSGSARSGPGRRCASGPASTSSTSRSPARASRACARTSAPPTSPSSPREGAVAGGPAAAAAGRGRARRSRSTARSTTAASSASPANRCSPPRSSAAGPVIVRIEPQTLMFLDPDTRELLRVRPNPLTPEQALRLQGARPAGPPPRPRTEPVTVQRRVSATGVITVCRQRVALGRVHAGRIVPSTSPSTRSRSSSTTKPARSAAPPPGPSSSSRAAGPAPRAGQRQRNSRPAPGRQRSIHR